VPKQLPTRTGTDLSDLPNPAIKSQQFHKADYVDTCRVPRTACVSRAG
jgi:hypothetical protein